MLRHILKLGFAVFHTLKKGKVFMVQIIHKSVQIYLKAVTNLTTNGILIKR